MKLETKQNEVRLVAENDLDKYYLTNFFKTKLVSEKTPDPYDEEFIVSVSIFNDEQ